MREKIKSSLFAKVFLITLALLFGLSLLVFGLFLTIVMLGIRRKIRYIRSLSREIKILEGGGLEYPITVSGRDELAELAQGLDALPEEVLAEAALFVDKQFRALAAEGYGAGGAGDYGEGNFGPGNVIWDDWRITGLSGPYYETAGDLRVEIWNVSYETHTTTPDRVVLAGGSYMGEDGWCMIGYPGCDYLYFRLDEDGNRSFLYSAMENDCSPGTETFLADMVSALTDLGLLERADPGG